MIGNNLSFDSSTIFEHNPHRIFYEPIPFEFLYTDEDKPQISVQVGDLPAVFDSLNSGFTFVDPIGQVTGFSLSGDTLIIDGTKLPLKPSITFANEDCPINKANETHIECKASKVAGEWTPKVTDDKGLIPVKSGLSPIRIDPDIPNLCPSNPLNKNGGNEIEIKGSNLPQKKEKDEDDEFEYYENDEKEHKMDVTFSNGLPCKISSKAASQVNCKTDEFSSESTTTIKVEINKVSIT